MPASASRSHRVVVVGGGFAGLYATRELAKAGPLVQITLVDRRNHHLFQPLLYQVATGALSPGEIAQPLRAIFRKRANTTVLLGEAMTVDVDNRVLELADTAPIPYDSLIVATGAHHSYFGRDEWAKLAPGLKTIDDATEIRRRILIAFEAAEREQDPERRAAWLRFVIVGGGPTGVELAGALGEIAHDTLREDFRSIHPSDARIHLVEGEPRILPAYPKDRSASARRQLEKKGVTVWEASRVVEVTDRCVAVMTPNGSVDIDTRTVLWAAGVVAASFARHVAMATATETDRAGRVRVGRDLTVPGHPEIFVVGDAAVQPWKRDRPVPGVAQGAIQAGAYAAHTILRRLRGEPTPPFHYSDRGDLAVIGRLAGVTNIPWLGPFGRQGGFIAWMLWLTIHIAYLIGFANRLVVLIRWGVSFFSRGRSTRLITGFPLVPPIDQPIPQVPAGTGAASHDPPAIIPSESALEEPARPA